MCVRACVRTIAKSTLSSRREPGSGRVEGVRFRARSGLCVKGAGIARVLNDCVWAPQERVKDAPSPSVSSSIQVPKILNTLCTYMQQSTHGPFLLRAVFLLTQFHREPVISSLLQKGLPMDRYVHYPLPHCSQRETLQLACTGGVRLRSMSFYSASTVLSVARLRACVSAVSGAL